jgi:hypothetical protein
MAATKISIRRKPCAEHPDFLIRDAGRLLDACGVTRSRQWMSRTVHAYLEAPIQGIPFALNLAARVELNNVQRQLLAELEDLRYLLTYSGPTGETAIRQLMKEIPSPICLFE